MDKKLEKNNWSTHLWFGSCKSCNRFQATVVQDPITKFYKLKLLHLLFVTFHKEIAHLSFPPKIGKKARRTSGNNTAPCLRATDAIKVVDPDPESVAFLTSGSGSRNQNKFFQISHCFWELRKKLWIIFLYLFINKIIVIICDICNYIICDIYGYKKGKRTNFSPFSYLFLLVPGSDIQDPVLENIQIRESGYRIPNTGCNAWLLLAKMV